MIGESIRDAVAMALPAHHRPLEHWSGPHRREWSWHFTAVGGGTKLLVKIPRWKGIDTLDAVLASGTQDDTRGEFDALVSIARAVRAGGDPSLTAVEPVVYVPEVNAIVLEWLEADPVRRWLGPRIPAPVAGPMLAAIGRWIRLYQESEGGWSLGTFDGLSAAGEWRALDEVGSRSRELATALEAMADAAVALDGADASTGTTHGDMTLSNVLVTPDARIAVIDPNRYRGSRLADVSRLGGELLLGRARLMTLGVAPGAARARGRVRALMDGYGSHDEAMFSYELAAACVLRWIELEERSGIAAALVASVDRRLFRSEISRLVG